VSYAGVSAPIETLVQKKIKVFAAGVRWPGGTCFARSRLVFSDLCCHGSGHLISSLLWCKAAATWCEYSDSA
jgi:hypothetical protein